ncbi:MAG: hypothetical protein AB8B69_10440 [Chitinophagales bacterium]
MKKILFIVSAFISICLLTSCSSDSSSSDGPTLKYQEAFQSAIDEYGKQKEMVSKSGVAVMSGKKNEEKKANYDKSLVDLEASLGRVNESGTKYFEDLEKHATAMVDGNEKTRYQKRIKSVKLRFSKEKGSAEKALRKLKQFDPQSGSKNVKAIVEYATLLNSKAEAFKGVIVKQGAGTEDSSVNKNEKGKKKGRKGGRGGKGGKKNNKKQKVQKEANSEDAGNEVDNNETDEDLSAEEVQDSTAND